jgi:integrase
MRRRFQNGSLKKKNGSWIGQWRDSGRFRSAALGRIRETTKTEALAKLAEILRPINSREATTVDFRTTVEDFVNGVYFPVNRRRWKKSTIACNEHRVAYHINKAFGDRKLNEITRDDLQTFLEEKASSGLSFSVVDHLRWDLSQIFNLARSEGAIHRNPAEFLVTPKNAAKPERSVMSREDVKKCLAVLSLRERLIFKLATFGGMRPGEILGLKWKHLSDESAKIEQRVYRGEIDTPKTRTSRRAIALSGGVREDIAAWRTFALDDGPEAWVFPSERNTPLSRDNVWRRFMQPKFAEAGLGWATFQVMRRTHSTLMSELKVDPKLVADQLGHTLDVNQNVYTLPNLARRQEAVNMLETAIQNAS